MLFQTLGDSNDNPDPFSIPGMLSYLVGFGFRGIVKENEIRSSHSCPNFLLLNTKKVEKHVKEFDLLYLLSLNWQTGSRLPALEVCGEPPTVGSGLTRLRQRMGWVLNLRPLWRGRESR